MEIYTETNFFLALNVAGGKDEIKCCSVCERKYIVRAREREREREYKKNPLRFLNSLRERYVREYIMITMIAIFVVIVPRLYAETFKSDPFVQSLSH